MIHLKRYFAAFTVMLTLMTAYALGIAPWLEPEPAVRRRGDLAASGVPERIGPTAVDLAALFSPGSWELDNPKIVETESCILLVKDYRPTTDGKLELNPCTLVFLAQPEGENGPRRPIVMQAPQGAVLQFDRPLDIARAQFGRLEGGLLPGPITIRSPESAPGRGDDLHLTTRQIQIDRDRVFTPHEVEFRYGESHGRGSDLTIHLLPKDPEDPHSGVGGLRSLVLARLDRLHLVVPGKVGLPGLPAGGGADDRRNADPAANEANTTTQLEVVCQGPVVFDMESETLLLDDGVDVERLLPGAPPDRLRCRQLRLVFRDDDPSQSIANSSAADAPSGTSPPPADRPASGTGDPLAGRIKQLIAIGNPARLEAPSSATVVTAAEMTLSVAKQRIHLDPSDEFPTVSLRQGANHFVAHKLDYELAPAGRLGKLWAQGPGELSFVQATGRNLQTISAQWRDKLSIRPQDADHVLSLTGNATVGVDPLGTFAAEQLYFWLREVEAPVAGASLEPAGATSAVASSAADAPKSPPRKYTLVPGRLLASSAPVPDETGDVEIDAESLRRRVTLDSPKLTVETRRLEVWFQNLPAVEKLPAVAERLPPTTLPREKPLKEPSRAKFALVGDLIQMQVIRRGDEAELEDLVIRGGVSIDEVETDEPNQVPVRLRGDSLELRGGVTGAGTIDLVGQPAEVGGRGMWLAGGTIHVVRNENRLWIDGPGEAKFPASAALAGGALGPLAGRERPGSPIAEPVSGPTPPPGDSPSERPQPPEDVHLVWRDRFHFDGQTALIDGDVQARTATQLASGSSLEVSLKERIDLAQSTSPTDAALARLKFDGGVTIENRTLDEHDEQIAFDTLAVRDLVIDAAAGKLTAAGPGTLVSRRLASAALPGVSSPLPMPVPMPTGPPADPSAPPKLNFIHIEFQGGIVGNIAQRQIEFQNQVRTIFAPIEAWDQSVSASRLEDLGEKGVLLTSDRLTVLEMAPAGQTPWIEAYASGGAVVEGKQFTVQAPRIAYTSDKEKLTIEGDGFKEAELWHRAAPGEPSSYAAARKWTYWLRTGELSIEGSKEFNIQQLPAGLLRLPGGRR
jgi:hypothetical protein